MTECIGGPVEEFAERYLNGSLPEAEAESFENHYFACDTCHETLLVMKDIQASLAAAPRAESGHETGHESDSVQPLRIVSRRDVKPLQLGTPKKFVAWGSIAAAILVAVVLTTVALNRHPATETAGNTPSGAKSGPSAASSPSASRNAVPVPGNDKGKSGGTSDDAPNGAVDRNLQIASLADVQLPGYHAAELRGTEPADANEAAFERAMKSYAQGDCGAALAQFSRVPDNSQHGTAARLYSGLCHFKAHELSQAQSSLERVVTAGDSPQLETAEYYLAQTMLMRSDATTARTWLRKTVALHGDYQAKAQTQLSQLVHLARQPWHVP
jgi:hypothetical protein